MATICMTAADPFHGFAWPRQVLHALAATAALVSVAYFFVDLPVFFFVRDHPLHHYPFLKWLTRPPEVFVILSPFVLLAGLLRRWFGPWSRPEKVALVAACSTLATALAVLVLKISFGRSCPHLVPSLTHGGVYGFFPFQLGPDFWAFPSGHTACTVSVTTVVSAVVPRWRWGWWALPVSVAAALIALNYHFVGDIFAGAFLGWAIGGTTARLFTLDHFGE